MNLVLDFLSELVPRFRTELCAFTIDETSETVDGDKAIALTCLGRVEDLDDDTEFDATMEVSSLAWLYMRAFTSFKLDTYEEYK